MLLFAAEAGGALRVIAAEGTWGGDALALQRLAESLDGGLDVLDARSAIEGARFAAGARLGDGEGALLVLASDAREPDDAWNEAFASATQLALGLVRTHSGGPDRARILHEVAIHPGSFDVRLEVALERVTEALGLNGAAFARIADRQWVPEAVFDSSAALVPVRPIPLDETFCAMTCRTDGPFVVQDAAASPLGVTAPPAYIGAPVFVNGRCVGTFSVHGATPRSRPFSDDDRALVESLARWIGSALAGRDVARKLAEREAALASFFDGAPMGMGVARLVVRADGAEDLQFVTVNAAAAVHLGGSAEAIAGRLASDIGLADAVLDRWIQACHAAAETQAPRRFDFEVPGADGPMTFTTTVARIAEAEDARYTFVVEDVTAPRRSASRLREREAELEAVVSQAPVTLFMADAQGRITMSRGHDADADGLGIERIEGRRVSDVFGPSPEAESSVEAALSGASATWTVEAGARWFECRALPVRDDIGLVSGLIGVAIDVTDRERGMRALARANRAVESVSQARTAFLKHLNHEIRSPLTSILGYADLLGEEAPPEEVVQVRDVIARSGTRLLGVLDDLLDLTLLDGTDVTVTPTPTNIGALVEAVAEANRTAAEARRISLNVWCLLPEGPLLIDGALLERVVRHLVGGAVASATGSRVDVRLTTRGTEWIEMTVLGGSGDDGTLGIGPDLVDRLVGAMGGEVDEVLGEPSGWRIRIPRRTVPVVDAPGPPAFGPMPTADTLDGSDEAVSMAVSAPSR
ncbi:MAG: histidine kinase dimerization/phospho-acceptor domain-containing protein [Bacteroidota bacterium]